MRNKTSVRLLGGTQESTVHTDDRLDWMEAPGDGRRCRSFIIRMEVRYRACCIEL